LKTVEDGRERSRLSKENGDKYYEPDFFACRLSFSRCKTRRYSRRHQAGLTTILHSVTLAANIDGRRLQTAKHVTGWHPVGESAFVVLATAVDRRTILRLGRWHYLAQVRYLDEKKQRNPFWHPRVSNVDFRWLCAGYSYTRYTKVQQLKSQEQKNWPLTRRIR